MSALMDKKSSSQFFGPTHEPMAASGLYACSAVRIGTGFQDTTICTAAAAKLSMRSSMSEEEEKIHVREPRPFQMVAAAFTPQLPPVDTTRDRLAEAVLQMVSLQEQTLSAIQELTEEINASSRRRAGELEAWKCQNVELADGCKQALEKLSDVQKAYLWKIIEEVKEDEETLMESDFAVNEFLDRFGPRLAHMNGMIQAFMQLSS